MSLYDTALRTLDGRPTTLAEYHGKVLLVVNVASRCGLTPQYETLEQLHRDFESEGFSVLGFPCNQFMGQEPGTNEEIADFCSTTYGVTFPMFDKVDVNGAHRHLLYRILCGTPDADGKAGDVAWNFEKFLIGRDGAVVARFRPQTLPDDPDVVGAIKHALSA